MKADPYEFVTTKCSTCNHVCVFYWPGSVILKRQLSVTACLECKTLGSLKHHKPDKVVRKVVGL